jgi:hypothetical protein
MVKLGGLPPLIDMLGSDSELVRRYATMTLCNLTNERSNQVPDCCASVRNACPTAACGMCCRSTW